MVPCGFPYPGYPIYDPQWHMAAESMAQAQYAASYPKPYDQKQGKKKKSNHKEKRQQEFNFFQDDPVLAKHQDVATALDCVTVEEKKKLKELEEALQEHGDVEAKSVLDYLLAVEGRVVKLCMQDEETSRTMQSFLEKLKREDTLPILEAMKGHVLELVKDQHGNFVIGRAFLFLTEDMTNFIVEELLGNAVMLVQTNYACRIFVRIIETAQTLEGFQKPPRGPLMEELLNDEKLPDLCRHKYAHHVLQAMLKAENIDNIPEEYRYKIVAVLCSDLMNFCYNRYGSFLVETALKTSCEEDMLALTNGFSSEPDYAKKLAENRFGSFVLFQLLQVGGECAQQALQCIEMHREEISESKSGKSLLQKLEEKRDEASDETEILQDEEFS